MYVTGSVLQKNIKVFGLSRQQQLKILRKELFRATLTLWALILFKDHISQASIGPTVRKADSNFSLSVLWPLCRWTHRLFGRCIHQHGLSPLIYRSRRMSSTAQCLKWGDRGLRLPLHLFEPPPPDCRGGGSNGSRGWTPP